MTWALDATSPRSPMCRAPVERERGREVLQIANAAGGR